MSRPAKPNHVLLGGLLLTACLAAAAAYAAEHIVTISHLEFDPIDLEKVQQGDTITFVNKSEIAHNLYLTYADGRMVTLDTQVPGTSKTARLDESGEVLVRCWIHPIIRMELDVAEAQ